MCFLTDLSQVALLFSLHLLVSASLLHFFCSNLLKKWISEMIMYMKNPLNCIAELSRSQKVLRSLDLHLKQNSTILYK